jgi:hypothetical protein
MVEKFIRYMLMVVVSLGMTACGDDADDEDEQAKVHKVINSWMLQDRSDGLFHVLTFTDNGRLVRSVLKDVGESYLRYDERDVRFMLDGYNITTEDDTLTKTWGHHDGALAFDGRQYVMMDEVWKARFNQAVRTTAEGLNYEADGTFAPTGDGLRGNWTALGYVLSFFDDGHANLTVTGKYKDVFHGKYEETASGCEVTFYSKQELHEDYTWSGEMTVQGSGRCKVDLDGMMVELQIDNDVFSANYQKM